VSAQFKTVEIQIFTVTTKLEHGQRFKQEQNLVRCRSDDPNRKSEEKGEGAGEQDPPPRKLKLVNVVLAGKDCQPNVSNKDAYEPPLRDLVVLAHQSCVHIHPLLLERRLAQLPYFSDHTRNTP